MRAIKVPRDREISTIVRLPSTSSAKENNLAGNDTETRDHHLIASSRL